jgi:endonuclease/exonuclease/phosphatase family metal-dependent hydrolase
MVAAFWLASAGCGPIHMTLDPAPSSCRVAVPAVTVGWLQPADQDDRRELHLWCEAVGPVVYYEPAVEAAPRQNPIVIATWNSGVGRGEISRFVNDLRSTHAGAELIVLMQEAFRAGDVPADCPADSRRAGRITAADRGEDIRSAAAGLGMHTVYIPSMRNGRDCAEEPREDRGNAIMSTLPLHDIVAIELPFAMQRRVAVSATVENGPKTLRLVSVHFDTTEGHRRQANGLIEAVKSLPGRDALVVGGDFNELSAGSGVTQLRKEFTEVYCGREATHDFPALRIDHLFTSGIAEPVECETAASSYGSDHWALIARPSLRDTPDSR